MKSNNENEIQLTCEIKKTTNVYLVTPTFNYEVLPSWDDV